MTDQKTMTYDLMERAFPDYDQAQLPPIPDDWEDVSWRNDTCPSFMPAGLDLQVFIAEADPAEREIKGGCRFNTLNADDPSNANYLLSTDYWTQVIDLVNRLRARKDHV